MMYLHSESLPRLYEYAARNARVLDELLGWGLDGVVYSTSFRTAIKAFRHGSQFERERDVYIRLFERQVTSVAGFAVPQLVQYDNELLVVEIRIVSPPYVLDFAGAYLDQEPPFSPDEWREWEQERRELFEDRWPEVLSVMAEFRRHGIHLNDVKPGNIAFAEDA